MPTHPEADRSYRTATRWRQEADALRKLLLQSGLTESFKWGKPCYGHDGRNICIVQRMNDFLALLFFKGALLKDPDGILEVQGPNSRSGYRARFTSVDDVTRQAESLAGCLQDAIAVEASGRKVERPADPGYPEELIDRLDDDPAFKEAFERLTPGRQRGYVLHFAGARQSATRAGRIDRQRGRILEGKGLHD